MTRFAKQIVRLASLTLAALVMAAAIPSGGARADWPEHTITIIVPFPAGGATDLLGRLLAAELAPKLGQNIIVENRVGAVGNIGLSAAARAAADGYTLLVTTNAVLINPLFDSSLSKTAYDAFADFAPIAYLGATPNFIIARSHSDITSVADLIAKAKTSPGKLTYASPGVGSSSQLAAELFKLRADIDIRLVAFDGSEPAMHGRAFRRDRYRRSRRRRVARSHPFRRGQRPGADRRRALGRPTRRTDHGAGWHSKSGGGDDTDVSRPGRDANPHH